MIVDLDYTCILTYK